MISADSREGAMRRHRSRRGAFPLAVALTVAALLGGCATLSPSPAENPSLYVLSAEPLRAGTSAPRDVVVEVALPRASPGFDTARIVYVQQPYELDYFAASRWADTPPRMLGPLIARALEQTGSFRAVVQTPSTVPVDYRVDTEIVRLQQDFATRPSRVELALRVQLTDVRKRRIVASRVFEDAEPAPRDDAGGGVIAANAVLGRLLQQVADFCVAESAKR